MRNIIYTVVAASLIGTACTNQEQKKESSKVDGNKLFEKVRTFVTIGQHRTGTSTDSLTSAWLKSELDSSGLKTEYVEFPLNQYFFDNGQLSVDGDTAEVFPVWPVKAVFTHFIANNVVDGDHLKSLAEAKGKIVLTRLQNVHGSSTPETTAQINSFIEAGALGVLALTENSTGEIVALNTYENQLPWNVPVYHVAPKDSSLLLKAISDKHPLDIKVNGLSKNIQARNVLGKVGSGSKYVVISTPISGWFTTGGERGPGIAIWLGLAKWASENAAKFPDYTFVFTGHSGHELNILGAKAFVEKAAPKPEDTKLWIHLGAGIAVKEWIENNGQWTLTDSVDSKRGIYYTASVADAFEKSFANIKSNKIKGTNENRGTVKPGGEGVLFQEKGYANLVSLAHGHRFHHVKSDREDATSPALLAELEEALEKFITQQISK